MQFNSFMFLIFDTNLTLCSFVFNEFGTDVVLFQDDMVTVADIMKQIGYMVHDQGTFFRIPLG